MQASQLRPASSCAGEYGVKMLAYGGPGSGKTPLVQTLPSPVLMACEPGLLSLRNWNGPVWEAYTPAAVDEFMRWLTTSNEAKQFHSVAIDSVSQMADIKLVETQKSNKHGMQAYGEMADWAYPHLEKLYMMRERHVYLTAKQHTPDQGGGIAKQMPYFPGNVLNIKVPYLYDAILHIEAINQPGVQGEQRVICTQNSITALARDRSGKLAQYEPFDLTALITKCMT